ncbi:MAG: hypothetical protein HY825_13490 [Acidobacteria bacterium]|nr:hypothetical protein [Acidobacteriota bacterium]
MHDRESPLWVADFLLNWLRFASEPVKRDELTDVVLQHSAAAGFDWKRSTAARRVREAIAELIDLGYPVSSTGAGLRLDDTDQAREHAAQKLERAAETLQRRARALRSGRQMLLALEAAGGAR